MIEAPAPQSAASANAAMVASEEKRRNQNAIRAAAMRTATPESAEVGEKAEKAGKTRKFPEIFCVTFPAVTSIFLVKRRARCARSAFGCKMMQNGALHFRSFRAYFLPCSGEVHIRQ